MERKVRTEKRPEGLYQGMSRLLFFCRLMLSIPYEIDGDRKLVVNSLQQTLQVTVAVLLCALMLCVAHLGSSRFSLQNPYSTLKALRNLVHMIIWLTYLIESKRQNSSFARIFERIKAIEDRVRVPEKQVRIFSRRVWRWILVSSCLCIGFAGLRLYYIRSGLVELLSAAVSIVIAVFPLLWDMPLWMLLTLCVYYVEYVNSKLKRTFTEQAFVVSDAFGQSDVKPVKTQKLTSLRNLFRKVDDLKNDVNDLFGSRIWLCILSTFIEIVHFFFFNITLVRHWGIASGNVSLLDFALFNSWKMLNAIRLLEVVMVSSKLAEKGQSTSIVIHELFAETTVGDQARNELAIFSLELLHVDVGVSGNGFFTVDYSLLSAIASAAVMYTIVLFQFDFPGYSEGIRPVEDMYEF